MAITLAEVITREERQWLASFLFGSALIHKALCVSGVAPGKEKPLAFAAVSLVAQLHFVAYGFGAIFDGTLASLSGDVTSRMASNGLASFGRLARIGFAYEVYNTVAATLIPEYRTGEFLGHHVLTALIAKFSQTQGPDFYGFFYLGMASLSSVFLVFFDVFKHGPEAWRAAFPAVNATVRVSFALSFLLVRTAAWPLVSLVFWRDTVSTLRDPPAGGGPWRPYVFGLLLSNTLLSGLQIAWGRRILAGLVKHVKKMRGAEEKKAE